MSLKTAFLNLFKPEAGDRFSITGTEGYNKNMDLIDAAVKKNADNINQLNSDIYTDYVTDLNNPPKSVLLNTGVNPIGLPEQLDSNGVFVIQQNPGDTYYTAQLAFSFGCDKIAIRRKKSRDEWSDWKYFTVT